MATKTAVPSDLLHTSQDQFNQHRIARISLDLLMQRLQQVERERLLLIQDAARLQQLIDTIRHQHFPQGETNLADEFLRSMHEDN